MISLESVSKRYGDGTVAVDDLSLDVARAALVVLVGPSGCGKTTTMKMVNRLVEPTSGRVVLDGEDVAEIRAKRLRRRIGYVIQNVGLFPHLTVRSNVATVPSLLHWDHDRIAARVEELLLLVGLEPERYADRYPHELSGGQRQRVGVARALAADPPVLLMDEPFGAVDPIARDRLQVEFRRLQRTLGTTVLFVTHDVEEAVRLGDRIAVLRQGGVLEQYATPAEILGSPATEFVASFVGADRGLRRLAVTAVDPGDLVQPPIVHLDDRLAEAGVTLAGAGARWAVVLDADGRLHGWLAADEARGGGTVRDRAHRMTAWIGADASLKDAFSAMLQENAGWVAVLDGERYLGVLTPNSLHEALRRSVEAAAGGVAPAEVDLRVAGEPSRWP
ncbi:MAG: ABC transporter ATP-binding protein [Mycobacterium leprae]